MSKPAFRTACLLAFTAVTTIQWTAPTYAQVSCDSPKIVDKLPKLPDGCQKERISAAGNERPTFFWARRSVEDHWQDQVLNKYGERFAVPTNAACVRQECVPSAIPGFTRCTFSGFPCASKPYLEDVLEISKEETKEMQRLLTRQGFRVEIDGLFGEETHGALKAWQKSKHLAVNGLPTRENLELLRKG